MTQKQGQRQGYGVLGTDSDAREATRSFAREIESRLVITNPRGDGSALTLVTRLTSAGVYEFIVEDENRRQVKTVTGNIFIETGHGEGETHDSEIG